ncbi:MAG: GNAT family N-acetyltransferase [Leptospiraceae bacterium]|nr:GNAT family N-acetyltransferase [Leptospiraceae bacterium]MCP5495977.1 GNAT family N-acetyltransferase [Leptospiraceae bacterium]
MAISVLEKTGTKVRQLEVRLAEDQYEIEMALALRYNVFNLEMGEGLPQSRSTQKDRDEYDYYCDHLIVLDKSEDNKVVGTYRILKGKVARENIGFYSETEFDLSKIYGFADEVAEVGRSCVHKDYRGGSVISLLWAGFAEYITEHNVRYLMGCGSIHSTDSEQASEIYAYLREKGQLAGEKFFIEPYKTHRVPGFDPNYKILDLKETGKRLPPLIKGYLRLGAKICGLPALDMLFGTIDLFVLFDSNNIVSKYAKHYHIEK